ncbi:peptidase [Guyanagaster necrorhizus]|uniref:Peptide hydrolase n=1 Tax=Guyanagaster necrorhizus TaxID=856835 RepID=A0A9P8AUL3_9AGAR|nr:peptidase [Guyanagaster necrorhizus MCA 3950]KAG7448593.1 peptidase [Guyanagaster necrorhizus MCA 3950]
MAFPSLTVLGIFLVSVAANQVPLGPDLQFDNHENITGFRVDLDALRLVQFAPQEAPVWITEREKLRARATGQTFFDITNHPHLGSFSPKERFSYPDTAKAVDVVRTIVPVLSTTYLAETLAYFSSFRTRYYNSDTGKASSEWLLQKIQNYTNELASEEQRAMITVKPFTHSWLQTSVIIRFASLGVQDTDPTTIIGAHCDSLNLANPFGPAPGADDDGSGTVTILEAYRALLVANYIPASPLEFHFYAAEEGGLLGSQDIVAVYEKASQRVKAMQQYDMTAWVKTGTTEAVSVMTNNIDRDLTEFQKRLIETYLDIPWVESAYPGYGASDHNTWTKAGYQACHCTEGKWLNMNRGNVHRPTDRIDISPEFSFDHMLQFSKLAVAFSVELSNY